MSQALYTSKTGISSGQTQIDVIANNVANINTTAYKTANVTFSTLFSKTISSGSAGTTTGGGTNPKQIGLGTQVASISRDFSSGSFQSTGLSSDAMISGNGYFVVQNGSGTQYLTRDGNFTLDSAGNLVTSSGLMVCGTSDEYSTIASKSTVVVPSLLNVEVSGTAASKLENINLGDLNTVSITKGLLSIDVGETSTIVKSDCFKADTPNAGKYTLYQDNTKTSGQEVAVYEKLSIGSLSETDRTNLTELFGTLAPTDVFYKGTPTTGSEITYIKGEISTATSPTVDVNVRNPQKKATYTISNADLTGTMKDFITNVNANFSSQGFGDLKFSIKDGGLQLENNTGKSIKCSEAQGSNILATTGLTTAIETAESGQTLFYSNDINKSAVISNTYNSVNASKRTDWTISDNGIVEATYNDGSSLTVSVEDGSNVWKFTTAEGITITGSGASGSDVDMTATGLTTANMVLELGIVVNDAGLVAEVDNLWTIGSNAGEFAYGMSGSNGFGNIKTGGLEGSNVDMATELSNMIVAQRAIQVNSRVFSTASSILETLAYLGQ